MTPEQSRRVLAQDVKPGTRKHALTMALIKAGDRGGTVKSLGTRVYGRGAGNPLPKLINVLRGVRASIEKLNLPLQVKREDGRFLIQDLVDCDQGDQGDLGQEDGQGYGPEDGLDAARSSLAVGERTFGERRSL